MKINVKQMFRTGVCLNASSEILLRKIGAPNVFHQIFRKSEHMVEKTLTFEYMFDIINKNTCSTGGKLYEKHK